VFRVILAGIIFLLAMSSHGDDDWRFSGFASLGAGRIYADDQRAIGYENEWSFDSDSVLGLQLDKEISEQWGFTGQIVANGFNYTGEELYTPELEWLLLRFEPTGDMQFRFGRVRNPLYLYSTTLEVGYTYPWVRPSANAYPSFLDPFKHLDGMDFVYNTSHGDVDVEYQIFAGRTSAEFRELDITAHSVFGANIITRWSDFTWRFNTEILDVSILAPTTDPLKDGFEAAASNALILALSPQAAEEFLYISNNLESRHKQVNYLSTSFMWEPGLWVLMSEVMYFRNEDNNFSNDADGFYISLSYQFNDITPYVTYGEFHNYFSDGITDRITATESLIPVGLDQNLDGLRDLTSASLKNYNTEQETIVLGFRYDFHVQASFKFEVEYFNFIKNTSGSFFVEDPTANPDDGLMTSFVIDVVF